jgi:lipopolysaccharide transport system permease protein
MKWHNKRFILELVRRDFEERFAGSVLGNLWSFIVPLVNILIYTIIFSNIMSARLPAIGGKFAYSIYLIAALLPWMSFSTTVMRSTTVLLDKKNLISKINIALPSMPLYISLSETVNLFISITIFSVFLFFFGHGFSEYILLIPFIFMLQQIMAYTIGLTLGIITVFIRDLKEVVGIAMQVWFWFTPIVYVKDILPQWLKKIIVFNPFYHLADSYQKIFLWKELPDVQNLIILTTITFSLLFLSYFLFVKLESDVKDFL